jgi:hypothetical protein
VNTFTARGCAANHRKERELPRGELERLGKTDVADLPRRRLGDEQVSAFKCSPQDGADGPARSTPLLSRAEMATRVRARFTHSRRRESEGSRRPNRSLPSSPRSRL